MAVIGAALHGPCVLLARTQTDMVAAENREWGLDLGAPQWHPIQKHQLFGIQPSLWFNAHIHT